MAARHEMTARVRKLRPVFFQIGMLIALGATLAAFKWTTAGDRVFVENEIEAPDTLSNIGEIRIIDEKQEQTQTETKNDVKTDPNQLKIVDNTVVLDTGINIQPDPIQSTFAGLPPAPFGIEDPDEFIGVPQDITYAEVMPSYQGGYPAMQKFIQKHLKVPHILMETAKDQDIKVYVQAVVDKDGTLTKIMVSRDGGYPEAGEAALAVVKKMPKWNPAYNDIWPARVLIQIPITIRIR